MTPAAPAATRSPLRIGNASGFYGDRFDALRDMLTGGPLDILTGDYLAELTMLILGRDRLKDPRRGYAKTFLRQLEECLGLAHDHGVRIVTNAGGLNPAALADAVRDLADRLGIPTRVAHVEGDDRTSHHPGTLAAHAYLGGAGIATCLREGAHIVITGRVTDAALVTGPAVAHFGWTPHDHDRLAGAVVAGHVLECGTQATGGNYAFFTDHDPARLHRPGFPLAELHEDGTSVITKHDGTGGVIDLGTVTAQLLYETQGARYAGPDVTARLDTVTLTQDGPDRVRVTGTRGEPPPPHSKSASTNSAASATRSPSSSPASTSKPRPTSSATRWKPPSTPPRPAPPTSAGISPAPTTPTPPPRRPPAPCSASSSATRTRPPSAAPSAAPPSNWRSPAIRDSTSWHLRGQGRPTVSSRTRTSRRPRSTTSPSSATGAGSR